SDHISVVVERVGPGSITTQRAQIDHLIATSRRRWRRWWGRRRGRRRWARPCAYADLRRITLPPCAHLYSGFAGRESPKPQTVAAVRGNRQDGRVAARQCERYVREQLAFAVQYVECDRHRVVSEIAVFTPRP